MSHPLISVIIPVYNVERYIREALDSVCNQTYRNLQIILVDDGSPDNCGAICDEYAARDTRIDVIHKTNGGVGSARNAGLDKALGDYILFFDPDDMMDSDLVAYLYYLSQTHGECFAVCNNYSKLEQPRAPEKVTFVTEKAMIYGVECTTHGPCARLFNRKTLGDLRFSAHRLGEDSLFYFRYLSKIQSMVHSTAQKYFYRLNEGSVTRQPFSAARDYDLLDALDEISKCYETSGYVPLLRRIAVSRTVTFLTVCKKMKTAHLNFKKDERLMRFFYETRMINARVANGKVYRVNPPSRAVYLYCCICLKFPLWLVPFAVRCVDRLSSMHSPR